MVGLLERRLHQQEFYARSMRQRADAGPPFEEGETAPSVIHEIRESLVEPDERRIVQRLANIVAVVGEDPTARSLIELSDMTPAPETCHEHATEAFRSNSLSQPFARIPLAFGKTGWRDRRHDLPDHVLIVDCLDIMDFVELVNIANIADVIDMQHRMDRGQ